jgi:hypothetical protein
MDEYIFAAIFARDKAEAFFGVEELYGTLTFPNHLCGHLRARASVETATAEAAAITAAARTECAISTPTAETAARRASAEVPVAATAARGIAEATPTAVKISAKLVAPSAPALTATAAALPIKTHT